jgi:UDP-N-acetylglucosamine 2-epimerase (non-hydrolysing)
MKRLLFVYGTRPEVIKLSPVVHCCSNDFNILTAFTGQHFSLIQDVQSLIPEPDFRIETQGDLSELSSITSSVSRIISRCKPDCVLIQGDTASVLYSAIAAFNCGVPIGYIESGLRTYQLGSPFPEEGYRQAISRFATYNFAPTERAVANLRAECVSGSVVYTGNTVVDVVMKYAPASSDDGSVLITLHRRENSPKFDKLLSQLEDISERMKDKRFIFPVHPNPIIKRLVDYHKRGRIEYIDPLPYFEFLSLLSRCSFVITDSGGIQEEATTLGKRTLVARSVTERPEAVDSGLAFLTGDNIYQGVSWISSQSTESRVLVNPFGDGRASERIRDLLLRQL